MDRQTVYPGAIPLETDLLNTNKYAMIGLAKLSSALMGTGTYLRGLACTPSSPASMIINVAKGEIYSTQNIDGTAYSSLPADTVNTILKQGIILGSTAFTLVAPTTAGQSVNYLVQVAYTDTDGGSTVLPYYNAANPSVAFSGPGGLGAAQYTVRSGVCTVAIKAGVAATTGTQTTPSADAGYTAAWVITVPQGATTITSANISQAPGAPFIPVSGVVDAVQKMMMTHSADTGAANAYAANYSPAITALTDGMELTFKANVTNTGASTFAQNGLTTYPIIKVGGAVLTGGEIIAGGFVKVKWNATLSSWVLTETTGSGATLNNLGLGTGLTGVVGATRNAAMSIATASASATFTADELIVETSAGTQYRLNAFSKTINIGTTGAGGMDTGTVTSGYVAIYAIYNPTTGASALLGASSGTSSGSIYSGSNMPSGYTASALVSTWLVSSSLLTAGYQIDRDIFPTNQSLLATTAATTTPSVNTFTTGAFPINTKTITGYVTITAQASQTAEVWILARSALNQGIRFAVNASAISAGGIGQTFMFSKLPVTLPQNLIYEAFGSTSATFSYGVNLTGYSI